MTFIPCPPLAAGEIFRVRMPLPKPSGGTWTGLAGALNVRKVATQQQIAAATVTATVLVDGTALLVAEIPASETANWAPGEYEWDFRVVATGWGPHNTKPVARMEVYRPPTA